MNNENNQNKLTETNLKQILEDLFEYRNDAINYETVNSYVTQEGMLVQIIDADGVTTQFELTIKRVN